MFGDNNMAPKRDLLRQSSSAEPRSGLRTTIFLSSTPDLGRRQNDGNRGRDRGGNNSDNRSGGGGNGGGSNGIGVGDSNDGGRGGENGRGGRGNGFGSDRGSRGDGSNGGDGGSGNNRGGGGGGRAGNNRNDGGSDRGSKNRGDSGGGGRNNDDRNNNNGNRFRDGGNRNGDGRGKDATRPQPTSSAASTASPATSSAPTPPTTEASGQAPVSPVSSIPPEVNGAISASSAAPAAGSTTMDLAAAAPSPPATTGGVAPGPGASPRTTTTVSVSSGTQGDSSLATLPSTPTPDAGVGIGDSAVRDAQWQKTDNGIAMGQRGVMSGTTERVLISIGSIGAFIFVSFLAWTIWRTARKLKRREAIQTQPDYASFSSQERPGFSHRLVARLPFLRNRQEKHWLDVGDRGYGNQKKRPLTFGPSQVPVVPIEGFYGSEKIDSLQAPPPTLAPPPSQQPLQILPLAQSSLPQLRLQTEQLSGGAAWSPMSPAARQQEQTGKPAWPMDSAQSQQMQFQAAFAAASNAYRPGALSPGTGAGTNISTHQTTGSFSSTNAAQFGATTPSSDVGDTWRSRPGPAEGYHNQNELARRPSDAYDPARRQVGRESVLSSLSSGFGDGDIVVPQQVAARGARAAGVNESEAQQYHTGAHASWTSRTDTVYTESSDDSPSRYRTITSWVRQQSGRVRKPGQQGVGSLARGASDGGVEGPGVEAMPPEPRHNMMMDDGQAPRSPETMTAPGEFTTSHQQE